MEVASTIEGQEDVTWADWVAIAAACERSGVGTLFRSDRVMASHLLHRDIDAIELIGREIAPRIADM